MTASRAFSETDFTEDLKKIDIPVIVMHGDDDQIVPSARRPLLSANILKQATLKVYPGFPHGMCTTPCGPGQRRLLAFFKALAFCPGNRTVWEARPSGACEYPQPPTRIPNPIDRTVRLRALKSAITIWRPLCPRPEEVVEASFKVWRHSPRDTL